MGPERDGRLGFLCSNYMPVHTDSLTGDFDVVEVKTQYENVWW